MPRAEPPGRGFDLVFFDCDSTLSAIEGIDELARAAGRLDEIAALTRSAMDGTTKLETVYGQRLAALRPSREDLALLGRRYVERLVPGALETLAALRRAGKEIHVVSGGLREAVLVLTRHLGLPDGQVQAVELSFDAAGAYAGFDESSPLARAGGKPEACLAALAGRGLRAAIVGDGRTDLEAVPPCELFVGFAGVVERALVREAARGRGAKAAWVRDPSLAAVLPHLLTRDERERLPEGVSP